jgi:hypothetical protein
LRPHIFHREFRIRNRSERGAINSVGHFLVFSGPSDKTGVPPVGE